MAETTVAPTNKAVRFRGKPSSEYVRGNRMPMESKAENAAMHAAAEGRSTIGIPKKVGAKFVRASKGQNIKKLPRKVKRAAKSMRSRGMISDSAAKKVGLEY